MLSNPLLGVTPGVIVQGSRLAPLLRLNSENRKKRLRRNDFYKTVLLNQTIPGYDPNLSYAEVDICDIIQTHSDSWCFCSGNDLSELCKICDIYKMGKPQISNISDSSQEPNIAIIAEEVVNQDSVNTPRGSKHGKESGTGETPKGKKECLCKDSDQELEGFSDSDSDSESGISVTIQEMKNRNVNSEAVI